MRLPLRAALILCAFCLIANEAEAQILSSNSETIIFKPDKVQKEVAWSSNFSLGERGLISPDLPSNQSTDLWVQTHPIPAGMSWRPPRSIAIEVNFEPQMTDAEFFYTRVYFRYSCDRHHWSTWYDLDLNEKGAENKKTYKSYITLPMAAGEKYQSLMRKWWKTEPAWSSDEHEFCVWLAQNYPDFFDTEFPFIGYVQIRVEKLSVQKSVQINSMMVKMSWGVGGIASIAKDPKKVRTTTGAKWFFDIEKVKAGQQN